MIRALVTADAAYSGRICRVTFRPSDLGERLPLENSSGRLGVANEERGDFGDGEICKHVNYFFFSREILWR